LFEKFMIVAQAATKTRMLDLLIIACQQQASADRPPVGLRGHEGNVEALRRCCVNYLHEVVGLMQAEAEELAQTALEPELKLMRDADRKRHLRAGARYLPALHRFEPRMRPVPVQAASRGPRLPAVPKRGAFRQEEDSIAAIGGARQPKRMLLPLTGGLNVTREREGATPSTAWSISMGRRTRARW
jgi:hypothetical protein